MKRLFLCAAIVMLMAGNCYAQPIQLGVMPLLKPELISRQLTPIKAGLGSQGLAIDLVFPKTRQEFAAYCQAGKITLAYAGAGYAGLLMTHYGFTPLLTSDQTIKIILFSKKNALYNPGVKSVKNKVFYAKENLLALFEAKKMLGESNDQLLIKSTADHVIYTVLEQERSAGIVLRAQLGLLNEVFKDDIYVHKSKPVGRLYVLLAPQLLAQKDMIQKQFLSFHENWKSTNKKYFYLNHFSFKKWQASDQAELEISDQFQTFLKNIQY